MLEHKLVYLEIDSHATLKEAFAEIRQEVDQATSRYQLTDLYNRAGYLIVLANDAFWERKFSDDIDQIRETAEDEFSQTARKINRQAEKLGLEGNYDEIWGD
jgi:hypothetical protein